MRLISHSGRTRSFYLSKLIASVTGRGDRLGEREPCTSYRLFGELCAGSSRRVAGLSCITCAAPARNGSSGTDRCTERERRPLPRRYGTCWRVAERRIAFPAHSDHRLRLELRHGLITRVWAGKSLSEQELEDLLNQIEADLKDRRIAEFGAEILFAHRPVPAGFRVNSTSMQILPPPNNAPLPQQMPADHPFVLEYPIQAFRSPELRHKRRHKNAVEW